MNQFRPSTLSAAIVALGLAIGPIADARADETCNSPYTSRLIKGQEDFVHVWTLGVKGLGDGHDKLVTIDANPASAKYGHVTVTSASVTPTRAASTPAKMLVLSA